MVMDTRGRLVAGSHNRNEFVLINADEIGRIKSVQELSGQKCQICGDEVEITIDGEHFVACNECAFPVCRTCYEYERKEGNQACPQCRTRYKRIKGSPRVDGDEEEEDFDDLEYEFDYGDIEVPGYTRRAHARLSSSTSRDSSSQVLEIPLLTYSEEDAQVSYLQHAIIMPPFVNDGDGIHLSSPGASAHLPSRPMVPEKDVALYGYGSVSWKDRMEDWKKRQSENLQMVKHQGNNDSGDFDGSELDPELPMIDG